MIKVMSENNGSITFVGANGDKSFQSERLSEIEYLSYKLVRYNKEQRRTSFINLDCIMYTS